MDNTNKIPMIFLMNHMFFEASSLMRDLSSQHNFLNNDTPTDDDKKILLVQIFSTLTNSDNRFSNLREISMNNSLKLSPFEKVVHSKIISSTLYFNELIKEQFTRLAPDEYSTKDSFYSVRLNNALLSLIKNLEQSCEGLKDKFSHDEIEKVINENNKE